MCSCRALCSLCLLVILPACGGRPLAAGGEDATPGPRSDSGLQRLDGAPAKPDLTHADVGCISLPGCQSQAECPDDQLCGGCHADPCCPMCPVCIRQCNPLPKTACSKNEECPDGAYCEHDGLCVVTGGKAGTCKKLPVCGDTGAKCTPTCGCDGKTYCTACEAHAAGVSVAVGTGGCLAPTCADLEKLYAAEVEKAKSCCELCASVQCVTKVAALFCGCETFVNTITPAMTAIKNEFLARSCFFSMPPCGIKCAPPPPAFCGPGGVCLPGGD